MDEAKPRWIAFVRKSGASLIITIPYRLRRIFNIRYGERILVSIEKFLDRGED